MRKLRDMNLLSVSADDERAIEVLVSGLPLFFGAQLAVDVTLPCVHSQEQPPTEPCAAGLEKTRNAGTPNFSATTGVVWSSLFWRQEEGGANRPCSSWRVWLCLGLERHHPPCNTLRHSRGDEGGPGCSLCPTLCHSRVLWWFHPKFLQVLTALLQIWQICLRRRSNSASVRVRLFPLFPP